MAKRPVSPRALKRAIAIIEESRYSHMRALHEPEYETTGNAAFHRRSIAEYEEVLKLLHRIETWLNP